MPHHPQQIPDIQRLETTKIAAEQTYTELFRLHPYGHRSADAITLLKRAARDYDRAMLDLANARLTLPSPPSAKPKNFSYHLHHHPQPRTVTIDRHHHHPSEAHTRREHSFRRSHPSYRPSGRFSERRAGYPFLNTCDPYAEDPSGAVSETAICASLDAFRLRCNRHGATYPRGGHCPRCHPETQPRAAPLHGNRGAKPRKPCLKPGSSAKALPPTPPASKLERPPLRRESSAQALREFQAGKQRERDAVTRGGQAMEVQTEFLQPRLPHHHHRHHASRSPSPQPHSPHHHHHSSRSPIPLLQIPPSPHHHHHRHHRSPSPAPPQPQHAHRETQGAWRDQVPQRAHQSAEERERAAQRGRELLLRGLEEPQHFRTEEERERAAARGRELLRRGLGM